LIFRNKVGSKDKSLGPLNS